MWRAKSLVCDQCLGATSTSSIRRTLVTATTRDTSQTPSSVTHTIRQTATVSLKDNNTCGDVTKRLESDNIGERVEGVCFPQAQGPDYTLHMLPGWVEEGRKHSRGWRQVKVVEGAGWLEGRKRGRGGLGCFSIEVRGVRVEASSLEI